MAGGLQQGLGAGYIGPDENSRIRNAPVHMGLRGKIDHRIEAFFCEQLIDEGVVSNISLDKGVARISLQHADIVGIAGVGQGIQVHHFAVGMFLQSAADVVASDKSGSAGDKNLHGAHFFHTKSLSAPESGGCLPSLSDSTGSDTGQSMDSAGSFHSIPLSWEGE
ncbi:hypothetical protein D3C75_801650 [compost metagenome]